MPCKKNTFPNYNFEINYYILQIQFPPTLSQRLAQRLLDISGRENLRTDLTALLALCEKTGDDIRACLSTLQVKVALDQRFSPASTRDILIRA